MISVGVYTLGCKLNQLESEAVARAFGGAGFTVFPWNPGSTEKAAPDILVVNTCTVTSKAEQKARRIIRKALSDNPRTVLVVTGCYAQLDPTALTRLSLRGARLFVLQGDKKDALLTLPALLGRERSGDHSLSPVLSQWLGDLGENPGRRFAFNPGDFSFHARAFLKIQDGCDNHCAYCRVALARGPSSSLPAPLALEALRNLEARGYGETTLTGVNIGQYHQGSRDLAGLLTYLLNGTGRIALRLSSLEPDRITPALLDTLSHPRVRPHFHLSVQSGSPRVLARMRRRYTPEDVAGIVGRLRDMKDDPFLACDIIAGFPTESGEDFNATFDLCRNLDFAGIHGFPYSRRPGTEAWDFPPQEAVPEREARIRLDRLLALGKHNKHRYIARWVGKTVEGIVEAHKEFSGSPTLAVSENYLKLGLDGMAGAVPPRGAAVRCRITGAPEREGAGFDAIGAVIFSPPLDTPPVNGL